MAYSLYDKHYLQEIQQEIFNNSDTVIEGNITTERIRDMGYLQSGNYATKMMDIISNEGDFRKVSNEIKFKSGLLAHWNFNSSEAIDESGRNNAISYVGGVFVSGVDNGNCVELIGTSDYITSATDFPDFTKTPYSISFWISVPMGVTGSPMNILNRWGSFGFKIYYNASNNTIGVVTKTSTSAPYTTETPAGKLLRGDGVWNHVVLMVNPAKQKSCLYLNNIAYNRATSSSTASVSLFGTPIIIGGTSGSTFMVDEMMFFSNYLSADVVDVLYNNPNGKYTDVRFYLNEKRDIII